MTTNGEFVKWLKDNWGKIREQLGEKWDEFIKGYQDIIETLPESPTDDDVEQIIEKICDLMNSYNHTRALMRDRQAALRIAVRMKGMLKSPEKTLNRQEQLRQICNRLKELVSDFEEPDRAKRSKSEGQQKAEGR